MASPAAPTASKTVETPRDDYAIMAKRWTKCRAFCGSEEAVKDHDSLVHVGTNFLIPFSPSMQQDQYEFLRREAELPGISAEFSQLLIGGLLRKEPEVVLPDDAPAGALEWITNEFGVDGAPLSTYMLALLDEEVTTSRSWIVLDYDDETQTPYAQMFPAESIVNWRKNSTELTQVIISVDEEVESDNEFHPVYHPAIYVHELNAQGEYQIRVFKQSYDASGNVADATYTEQIDEIAHPLFQGKPMTWIPIWPGNGSIDLIDPFLLTIVNKEIALYNKMARRNHLLYGAATYTPYVSGVQDVEAFNTIVRAGLGSWLHLPDKDAKVDVLKTPTEALVDLDRAIVDGIAELAKLGVRMLSPETAQSGVALQMRNAAQTARLGTLNTRVSVIMSQVIAAMLNWRYDKEYTAEQIGFKLQDEFTQTVVGEGWLRLATEWYENGHIPREIWLQLLKDNDVIPNDYDDVKAAAKIEREGDAFRNYSEKLKSEEQPAGPQPVL